jgi:hypothetical protein
MNLSHGPGTDPGEKVSLQLAQQTLGMNFTPAGNLLFVPLQCDGLEGAVCRIYADQLLNFACLHRILAVRLLESGYITRFSSGSQAHCGIAP